MPTCGSISEDILINCAAPLVGGNKDRLVLMNQSDIEGLVRNVTNTQIIEGINLVASPAARAYQYEGKNNSIDSKTDLVKTRYSTNYDHQVIFRIFGDGPTIKQQVESLVTGKIVAILEKNYRGEDGEASFEIRGLDVGLEVTALTKDDSDAETQGAYVITLSSPEAFKEPHLPATLFLTDYATTRALVDALLVA